MPKVDLHTHSKGSPDGSLKIVDYQKKLLKDLDSIAITDHNTIAYALEAQVQLGDRIIVGEEITTAEGEIIGLYLTKVIEPGLSAAETVTLIRKQGGLVYVPHPFETVRKGLPENVLNQIAAKVDIVEVRNGRAIFQNYSRRARKWATRYGIAMAASSDAHGWHGWGRTYSEISKLPTRKNLVQLLPQSNRCLRTATVGLRGVLYPKFNRLRGHK